MYYYGRDGEGKPLASPSQRVPIRAQNAIEKRLHELHTAGTISSSLRGMSTVRDAASTRETSAEAAPAPAATDDDDATPKSPPARAPRASLASVTTPPSASAASHSSVTPGASKGTPRSEVAFGSARPQRPGSSLTTFSGFIPLIGSNGDVMGVY